ncbi:MmgE/PrpD family protein [Henriciella mobilis]|uniref:MmgE/PrpD family protein n=1 Tax=Henriciella mobilis TaxID=2305467 RepID=A0A399RTB5_9PROT|nr:MmgE/PrpD family protein [Henriciella mobilis]RIJ32725.1 MmgE/PrpD family protein [Henriciella mobilis]
MALTPELAIAQHVASCSFEQIPAAAVAVAKRSLIDGMAALVAGRRADGIDSMLSLADQWGGAPEARIFASGRRAPAPLAAWINGAQMRALELDDCTDTLPLHPTAALLPALLAALDITDISGKDLVRGLAIAQDLKIRFGLAITPNAMRSGRNSVYRVFAATAGVASVLGLDEKQTLNALGLSASYGAGDAQCALEGVTALRIQFGNSAHGALHSCLLAKLGATGPKEFLTGRYGYLTAFEPQHDLDVLLGDLGKRFEGTRISVKPYAACRCTHAAIDLAKETLAELAGINVNDITNIEIVVSPEVYNLVGGPRETKLNPETSAAAQFSLNFMVASVLLGGEAGLADTETDKLTDSDVLSLAQRIHVKPDESNRTAEVVGLTEMIVTTNTGQKISLQNAHPLGGPTNIIPADMLRQKLEDCISYSGRQISADAINQFLNQVEHIEKEPNASGIFDPFD